MRLYNTLTRKKEEFSTIEKDKVRFYSCGPTVYNFCHIGNARPIIIFDILRRYLEYKGYTVVYIQNFTDIDDKVIKKSLKLGKNFLEVSKTYIEEYFCDADQLMIKRASFYPKASENIAQIIEFIQGLIEKNYAYFSNGSVYFSTKKFKKYGHFSRQDLSLLESGARVEENLEKKDPLDFVLWKAKKELEPFWESPWGDGRPGWHIECSAMVKRYLGKTIDIHAGGQDLIFPHHENEIAQSEALNEQTFARFWVHNGYVKIDNKKMSKSFGNFYTIREISDKFGYEPIRFFMLLAHYRSPINFNFNAMHSAKNGLERLYNCIENLNFLVSHSKDQVPGIQAKVEEELKIKIEILEKDFYSNMDDDLNTAGALSSIFEIVQIANTNLSKECSKFIIKYFMQNIKKLSQILGILNFETKTEFSNEIKNLLYERKIARENKEWKKSDEIRKKLQDFGVLIKDTNEGQNAFWEKLSDR